MYSHNHHPNNKPNQPTLGIKPTEEGVLVVRRVIRGWLYSGVWQSVITSPVEIIPTMLEHMERSLVKGDVVVVYNRVNGSTLCFPDAGVFDGVDHQ